MPGRIAAVIVEPVVGNGGFIPPRPGFLAELRRVTENDGALLIFDEVMTGFRVAPGGAQERFGVKPDLTTLGKVIGGGLPVGAYGGRREVMEQVAPVGPIYQAGTLSGNPLAMAAGLAQLRTLRDEDPFAMLEQRTRRLVDGLLAIAGELDVPATGGSLGSMWGIFFSDRPVHDFAERRQRRGALPPLLPRAASIAASSLHPPRSKPASSPQHTRILRSMRRSTVRVMRSVMRSRTGSRSRRSSPSPPAHPRW
jgi:glutamate-1-semialdehyde 2,1-aminomutase